MQQIPVYLPPPLNWQDFQRVMCEVAKVLYLPNTVEEYGRQGQQQYGIDILAADIKGDKIGIQCKELKGSLKTNLIDNEIIKAKNSPILFNYFIIATTAKTDTKIQDYVSSINKDKKEVFWVKIMFWEEINNIINRCHDLMGITYSYYSEESRKNEDCLHLNGLRIALDRPAFLDMFKYERNYNEFEQALSNTLNFFKTGNLYDRNNRFIYSVTPVCFLENDKYRRFAEKMVKKTTKMYYDYLLDKKRNINNSDLLDSRAEHYDKLRFEIIDNANKMFKNYGIQTIHVQLTLTSE
ncbi:TPA: hypothetical protein ACSTL5_001460 [Serratia fonticola]